MLWICSTKEWKGLIYLTKSTTAYNLDRKSPIFCYLNIFPDLVNIFCANSFIAYNLMHQNELTLLDFKTIISTNLVGCNPRWNRPPAEDKTGSKRKYWYQYELRNVPIHLQEFQHFYNRCAHCYKEGFDRKTYIRSTECGVFLCLEKEKNGFLKHHS